MGHKIIDTLGRAGCSKHRLVMPNDIGQLQQTVDYLSAVLTFSNRFSNLKAFILAEKKKILNKKFSGSHKGGIHRS